MNKSEIAEKAAREILAKFGGVLPHQLKICTQVVERAIAESQPRIKYTRHAESSLDGCDPKSCQNGEHFFYELGDGEPSSPPPDKLKSIKRWIDAAFDVQDFFVRRRSDGEIVSLAEIVNEADIISEIWRSGAAQEVSPPVCPFGYTKESPGTRHNCAIHSESDYEEVSPPSPVALTKICNDYRNDTWRGRRCDVTIDRAVQAAYELGRGDTRELKAALTVVEKAKAYVTICDDWRGDNSEGAMSLRRKAFLELSEAVSKESPNGVAS